MGIRRSKKGIYGKPSPSGLAKPNVEEYAERVAKLLGRKPGDDVAKHVEALGGRIRYVDLESWVEQPDSIIVHGPDDFEIVLGYFTSTRRDQFTMAHELGHYFLHSHQGERPLVARRSGTGRVEWEANWFAGAFLMPRKVFAREWQAKQDVNELASLFNVSRDAVLVRKRAVIGG